MEPYERLAKLKRKKEKIDKEIAALESKIQNGNTEKSHDEGTTTSQITVPIEVYDKLSKKYYKLKRKYYKLELEKNYTISEPVTETPVKNLNRVRTGWKILSSQLNPKDRWVEHHPVLHRCSAPKTKRKKLK